MPTIPLPEDVCPHLNLVFLPSLCIIAPKHTAGSHKVSQKGWCVVLLPFCEAVLFHLLSVTHATSSCLTLQPVTCETSAFWFASGPWTSASKHFVCLWESSWKKREPLHVRKCCKKLRRLKNGTVSGCIYPQILFIYLKGFSEEMFSENQPLCVWAAEAKTSPQSWKFLYISLHPPQAECFHASFCHWCIWSEQIQFV